MSMTNGPTISDYIHEMVMDCSSLMDAIQESARLPSRGRPAGACEALAVSHYKLSALVDEREALPEKWSGGGVRTGATEDDVSDEGHDCNAHGHAWSYVHPRCLACGIPWDEAMTLAGMTSNGGSVYFGALPDPAPLTVPERWE